MRYLIPSVCGGGGVKKIGGRSRATKLPCYVLISIFVLLILIFLRSCVRICYVIYRYFMISTEKLRRDMLFYIDIHVLLILIFPISTEKLRRDMLFYIDIHVLLILIFLISTEKLRKDLLFYMDIHVLLILIFLISTEKLRRDMLFYIDIHVLLILIFLISTEKLRKDLLFSKDETHDAVQEGMLVKQQASRLEMELEGSQEHEKMLNAQVNITTWLISIQNKLLTGIYIYI